MSSNTGRRRRSTRSVAPSPTTSSSPSAPRPREPQPSRPPQWKFSQVLGEPPPAAEIRSHRDGALQDDGDEISAVEFDGRGEYLAAGDNAGRVILFRRTDGDDDDARPRAELERADHAGAPPPRYSYATEFQCHEQEFDALHSLEISEMREGEAGEVVRAAQQLPLHARRERSHGEALEGQVSERKAPKRRRDRPRWDTKASSLQLQLQEPYSEWAAAKPRSSSADPVERPEKVGDVGEGYSAKCRRVFERTHEFNINSISNNCDGETFVSADDVRINLWHLEVTSRCFNIVDMKPADMEDLVEVITTAEFHPSSCSLLAYGSSSGLVRLVDLRRSALCDQSVRIFQDRKNRLQPSTFFTEIISCITDLKFTGEGKYLLTRDYLNLKVKLWDLRVETSPVATYNVHEFLRPKLSELYADDYIFDRFSCCASKDGAYFATGSYSNTFKVFSRAAAQKSGTTLEASTNPYRIQLQAPPKIPALLSNFSLGVNRKGQDGPRSDGKEEVTCNMASKVKHLAWHPAENFIVCAANNSLYMYHT